MENKESLTCLEQLSWPPQITRVDERLALIELSMLKGKSLIFEQTRLSFPKLIISDVLGHSDDTESPGEISIVKSVNMVFF